MLEDLAAEALSRREFREAFAFADRRCRDERPAEALSLVLRADALVGLGDRQAALEDIGRALQLEPDNPHANRRLMAWGGVEQRLEAARTLARISRDLGVLRGCARVLSAAGRGSFAAATILEDEIIGWAYWDGRGALELSCAEEASRVTIAIERDASAPLGEDFAASARFRVPRPAAAGMQHIAIRAGDVELFAASLAPKSSAHGGGPPHPPGEGRGNVAVIVPVHGDFAATRACLASLLRQLPSPGTQIILVDDASPDARIVALLEDAGRQPGIRLLRNPRNLGFVGAVNRALQVVGAADAILLNADTLVPPGFIERLRAAAHASDDIGTVTPLSNNGELTSFPVFARANPLPSLAGIERIDGIARIANAGRAVDLPNGIGFCLYIKRACLDAIGLLSEGYERGYYEDVDWCLSARERGFRNVCACDVFVGHAGARSFGGEKRSLVLRNLAVLEQRYPEHVAEVAAFVKADPLRPARAALERALALSGPLRLIVTGAGRPKALASARAERLADAGAAALVLIVEPAAGGPLLVLRAPRGGVPQALAFDLRVPGESAAAAHYLAALPIDAIEYLDPSRTPAAVLDLLGDLAVPFDLVIADAGLSAALADEDHGARWQGLAAGARRILVPDAQAAVFVSDLLPDRRPSLLESRGETVGAPPPGGTLGVAILGRPLSQLPLLKRLARLAPGLLVILGPPPLGSEGVWPEKLIATGALDPDELGALAARYRIGTLVLAEDEPSFGDPLRGAAFGSGRPCAYLDWSLGRCRARANDLPLDPRAPSSERAASIAAWAAA